MEEIDRLKAENEHLNGIVSSCTADNERLRRLLADGEQQSNPEGVKEEEQVIKKFNLCFYGIEESDEVDCSGLSEDEINRELVEWVLERVDHWVDEVSDE
ncbi:hypothetical protein [Paenibacillus sp. FSL R5-0810]|uniref:hypothetical protein n=1 Tax=Paenibacillus sp. FSL R5-0810 TaxID=2921659 RepID=UPI0030F98BCF